MSKKASDRLVELSNLCLEKSKAYGPQKELIKKVFDTLLDEPIVIKNGDDAWKFHLLMEILAKNMRMLNLYVNKEETKFESLIDSLEDSSVYNVLLSTDLKEVQ